MLLWLLHLVSVSPSAWDKITPRAAFDHLRALERKGMLQRRPSAGRTSRALVATDAAAPKTEYRAVPVLGRIAAGTPLLNVMQ